MWPLRFCDGHSKPTIAKVIENRAHQIQWRSTAARRCADAFGFIRDDELFLQLVQEAEGQHVGVVCRAHHQVPNTQWAYEAETKTSLLYIHCTVFLTEMMGHCNLGHQIKYIADETTQKIQRVQQGFILKFMGVQISKARESKSRSPSQDLWNDMKSMFSFEECINTSDILLQDKSVPLYPESLDRRLHRSMHEFICLNIME